MINIKIKKLTSTCQIPKKAHETDACFDIYADCPDAEFLDYDPELMSMVKRKGIVIYPNKSVIIKTGFSTEIPTGYFAAAFCRSGLGIKHNVRLCNSVGVIDSEYRGEWVVGLHNDGEKPYVIHHGDRIAQFTLLPVLDIKLEESEDLTSSDRGEGGLGSTGG